jgi:hypothetical protein
LTWNAGAARLLVPAKHSFSLLEMKTGKFITIKRDNEHGTPALRIIFDDESDYPYSIILDTKQCDRQVSCEPSKEFIFSVWTKDGKNFELPGKFL